MVAKPGKSIGIFPTKEKILDCQLFKEQIQNITIKINNFSTINRVLFCKANREADFIKNSTVQECDARMLNRIPWPAT